MKVLIVYAHMEPRSFNASLLERAKKTLERKGAEVRVSDLYAMGFNPIPGAADFKDHEAGTALDYYAEQKRAYEAGTLADDIVAEIENLDWCDILILQFPLYWFSMPAILKGWVDRVLVPGFAYGGGAWYDKGGLKGKRGMVVTTMAAFQEMMAPDGINGLVDVNLWPIQNGILAFCGFDVLPPFMANAVPYVDDAARGEILSAYEARLMEVDTQEPLSFHRRDDFDRTWKLKPSIEPRTVGHYFASLPSQLLQKLRK